MSVQVTIELPEEVFSALRSAPDDFVNQMRLAAAVKWYELGLLSQSKAATVAGLSRHDLLTAMARFNVSPFQTTRAELKEELARG